MSTSSSIDNNIKAFLTSTGMTTISLSTACSDDTESGHTNKKDAQRVFDFPAEHLDAAGKLQYYNKLRVYIDWEPTWLSVAGNCGVRYNYGEKMQMYDPETVDRDFPDKPTVTVLLDKPGFEGMGSIGYLFNKETAKKADVDMDATDKAFMLSRDGYEKFELFALHTYGGYYGFFRPDLCEVIHLIHNELKHPIDSIDHMFVTTTAFPSSDVGACYDSEKDGHRAMTVVYVKMKARALSKSR